jgi:hypothetical protein
VTEVEGLRLQRRVLDQRIRAAERRELDARFGDIVRRLADNGDLPLVDTVGTTLQVWRDRPDHTVAEFLEVLEAAVSAHSGVPRS